MICLPARLPLLEVGNQAITEYGEGWLSQSISQAAESAGHGKWLFAEDVARGVIEYLRDRFPGSKITLGDLFERISRTLDTIGFPDIAAQLQAAPPPARISLADLAREAGPGCELFFFCSLDERFAEARASGVDRIRFTGFDKCVQALVPDARAVTSREALRAEVLSHLRHRAASAPGLRLVIR